MTFDLNTYAKQHRYRVRNLHDGYPVPPMKRSQKRTRRSVGYVGLDRMDAIVGQYGYVADEGRPDYLGIACFYRSTKGRERARLAIEDMGGVVVQEGDDEIAGAVPISAIDEAMVLIRVYRVKPGNPHPNISGIHPDNTIPPGP